MEPEAAASSGWRAYKVAWRQAGEATEASTLKRLVQRLPQLRAEFEGTVDEPLAGDLMGVVAARAANRLEAVAPPFGDLPGPDRVKCLHGTMSQLEQAHRALAGLRRLGWKDPWIEASLATYAAFLASVVQDQAGQLELERGTKDELASSARKLVKRLTPTLPPLP